MCSFLGFRSGVGVGVWCLGSCLLLLCVSVWCCCVSQSSLAWVVFCVICLVVLCMLCLWFGDVCVGLCPPLLVCVVVLFVVWVWMICLGGSMSSSRWRFLVKWCDVWMCFCGFCGVLDSDLVGFLYDGMVVSSGAVMMMCRW